MKKPVVIAAAVGLLLLIAYISTARYRPALFSPPERTSAESIRDFFGFGLHYSRYCWLRKSARWKDAARERLQAFWYRPHYSAFEDIREKSLFELGRWYRRRELPSRAARILVEACRRNPENRWLIRRSSAMMRKMGETEALREIEALFPGAEPSGRGPSAGAR